jgi:aerobic-type carbon monoxide dehydrogenase small subunit (CoxS/CutS family)
MKRETTLEINGKRLPMTSSPGMLLIHSLREAASAAF